MRKALVLAFVSALAAASAAAAARPATPDLSLERAVRNTDGVSTLRYAMTISIARKDASTLNVRVRGTRGRASLAIHVQESATDVADGISVPGPHQSAIIDGPFLYEGAPNGIAIDGTIRWLRVPVARIGQEAPAMSNVRSLSPAPLLRLLDEWAHAKARSADGWYRGTVAYDDPIVLAALSGMTGGIEFRNVRFSAHADRDGYLHTIRITGQTADGTRSLTIDARLYAFGWPVRVEVPGEGAFIDQKLLDLEE
jgi:hypothetical protein